MIVETPKLVIVETPKLGVSTQEYPNLQQIADKNEFTGNLSGVKPDGFLSTDGQIKIVLLGDDTTTGDSCAAIKISMIFFPAAATEVPGPKIATTPAS